MNFWVVAQRVAAVAAHLPWETMLTSGDIEEAVAVRQKPRRTPETPPPSPPSPPARPPRPQLAPALRPGCTAADESLTVLGHLQGLAAGWGGWGVLKTDHERLERAAGGAERMGASDVAQELRGFTGRLDAIRDEEAAREAARDLVVIARKTWALGMACGKHSKLQEQSHEDVSDGLDSTE